MLAGENMFRAGVEDKYNLPHENKIQTTSFNNRLRENWLQQQYDNGAMRVSAPMALREDYNSRVYGEQPQPQIDFKGEFS